MWLYGAHSRYRAPLRSLDGALVSDSVLSLRDKRSTFSIHVSAILAD